MTHRCPCSAPEARRVRWIPPESGTGTLRPRNKALRKPCGWTRQKHAPPPANGFDTKANGAGVDDRERCETGKDAGGLLRAPNDDAASGTPPFHLSRSPLHRRTGWSSILGSATRGRIWNGFTATKSRNPGYHSTTLPVGGHTDGTEGDRGQAARPNSRDTCL